MRSVSHENITGVTDNFNVHDVHFIENIIILHDNARRGQLRSQLDGIAVASHKKTCPIVLVQDTVDSADHVFSHPLWMKRFTCTLQNPKSKGEQVPSWSESPILVIAMARPTLLTLHFVCLVSNWSELFFLIAGRCLCACISCEKIEGMHRSKQLEWLAVTDLDGSPDRWSSVLIACSAGLTVIKEFGASLGRCQLREVKLNMFFNQGCDTMSKQRSF